MHPDRKTYGGTAIIIRSSIKHYEIDKHQTDFLQATSFGYDGNMKWLHHYLRSIFTTQTRNKE